MADRFDLIIRNAAIYDGSGAAPFTGNVAIKDDRIAAGGRVTGAGREIDARGLAIAPGFIDVHSHDDFVVFIEPEMDFKVMQGVTTDVVGNCGLGAAPYAAAHADVSSLFTPIRRCRRGKAIAGTSRRSTAILQA